MLESIYRNNAIHFYPLLIKIEESNKEQEKVIQYIRDLCFGYQLGDQWLNKILDEKKRRKEEGKISDEMKKGQDDGIIKRGGEHENPRHDLENK